jgi:competence protein ComGC
MIKITKLDINLNELNIKVDELKSDGYLSTHEETFDGEYLKITQKGIKLFKNR